MHLVSSSFKKYVYTNIKMYYLSSLTPCASAKPHHGKEWRQSVGHLVVINLWVLESGLTSTGLSNSLPVNCFFSDAENAFSPARTDAFPSDADDAFPSDAYDAFHLMLTMLSIWCWRCFSIRCWRCFSIWCWRCFPSDADDTFPSDIILAIFFNIWWCVFSL